MRLDRVDRAGQVQGTPETQAPLKTGATGFSEALQRAAGGQSQSTTRDVEFSGHAKTRLSQRGIDVDEAVKTRLCDGVDRAAAKGSRTALVMVDSFMFVVGVDKRNVITVADQEDLRERVFTNIDSMVIA